jgi:hypothetical protein
MTYVIVSPADFKTALQPFVAWKKLEGYNVIEAYTDNPAVGSSVSSIKAYLKNLYENPPAGYNPPAFILIVGDVEEIPATQHTEVSDNPYTDLDYAEYTGDYLPEVYYGRWSADNATQVEDIVYKTIRYEKLQMADPSYLKQTLLVPGDDESHEDTYGGGAMWYAANYYLNAQHNINCHLFLQSTVETWPNGNTQAHDSIIANINKGVALANYTAHCSPDGWYSPSFSQADLRDSVRNTDKYGIWIANCCQSSKFDENEAFSEMALRMPNSGVVGYIGASQYTYWDEDYYWDVGVGDVTEEPQYDQTTEGAYDGLFHDKSNEAKNLSKWFITTDGMIRAGNLAVQASGSNLAPYYWVIYNLMGDPSLIPYVGSPKNLTLTLDPQTLFIGTNNFTITSQPYTYIAITQDSELQAVVLTDSNGFANVNLKNSLSNSNVYIVAKCQFHKPVIDTITPISPEKPYVLSSMCSLSDSTTGSSGFLNANFKNFGLNTAKNLTIKLVSNDTNIIIKDSIAHIDSIKSLQTVATVDSFSYTLKKNIPDQFQIPISFIITGNDTLKWISNKQLTVNAPIISTTPVQVADNGTFGFTSIPHKYSVGYAKKYTYNISAGKTKNNRLDFAEIDTLIFTVKNTGHAADTNIEVNLNTFATNLALKNSTKNIFKIKAQSDTILKFLVNVDSNDTQTSTAQFQLTINSSIGKDTNNFTLPVNLIAEDFESGNLLSFRWQTVGDTNWQITGYQPYQGRFCVKSGEISDNQTTGLKLLIPNVAAGDKISFYHKESSEKDYDFLNFLVNNQIKKSWSGLTNWSKYEYTFSSAGDKTIEFQYAKDYSTAAGDDCAYIDFISFPVMPQTNVSKQAIEIKAEKIPSWLYLTDNGDGTAILSGTAPSANESDTIIISATNGKETAKQKFSISVNITNIFTNNNNIKFYPNPSTNYLTISISKNFNNASVNIYDINGRKILDEKIHNPQTKLNLQGITKGIYILKLDIDGQKVYNKIIKQ